MVEEGVDTVNPTNGALGSPLLFVDRVVVEVQVYIKVQIDV